MPVQGPGINGGSYPVGQTDPVRIDVIEFAASEVSVDINESRSDQFTRNIHDLFRFLPGDMVCYQGNLAL